MAYQSAFVLLSAFAAACLVSVGAAILVYQLGTRIAGGSHAVRQRLLVCALPPHASRILLAQRERTSSLFETWLQSSTQRVLQILRANTLVRTADFQDRSKQISLLLFIGFIALSSGLAVYHSEHLKNLPAPMAGLLSMGMAWLASWATLQYGLRRRIRRRVEEIDNGLSNALDLLVLCLGAGASFQNALIRVSEDRDLTTPALHRELGLTNEEIRAGCTREESLRHLARRCAGSAYVQALVSTLIQSDRLGSSLEQTLKAYSDHLRFMQRQNAKEQIQKIPVKITFPLVFLIFPSLFVVVMGPSLLRLLALLNSP